MKKTQFIPIALLSISAVVSTQSASRPPNIVLFLVDDIGWEDTSSPFWIQKTCYNEAYEASSVKQSAKGGMMFTQVYASSISSLTHCSLITGMNAARHRVTGWTLFKDGTTDWESDMLTLSDWNYNSMAQVNGTGNTFVDTSFMQMLKNNGCRTIHYSKAHFGAIDIPGEDPHHWGFEVNIAGHIAGDLTNYLNESNYGHAKDGKPHTPNTIPGLEKYWGSNTLVAEALAQEAIRASDKAKKYNRPFYPYMSHYAIHIPIDKDEHFYQKYIDKGLTAKRAAYAALIEGTDKSLGDLVSWLERNDEVDNTIVVFMSDSSGLSSEPGWCDGKVHTQNYSLNSGKGSAYKREVREPTIVRWSGVVKLGSKCDKYLIIKDFYPAVLETAGIKEYRTIQPTDDINFAPLSEGTGDPSVGHNLFWNCPNIWGNDEPGIDPTCSVRNGGWKLIYYYETGKKELFNVTKDIGGHSDVVRWHPDIVECLSEELGTRLRKVSEQRPSSKAIGKPVP